MGRKVEATIEITAWYLPNQLGFKSVSGPIQFEVTMKLEPKDNGTQFNQRGTAEIGGFFKIAEGLVAKQLEKQVAADFEALKQVLEAGQE